MTVSIFVRQKRCYKDAWLLHGCAMVKPLTILNVSVQTKCPVESSAGGKLVQFRVNIALY